MSNGLMLGAEEDKNSQTLLSTQKEQPARTPVQQLDREEQEYANNIRARIQQEQDVLRQSLMQSVNKNPDQIAQIEKLSKQTGVPQDVVERNLATVLSQKRTTELEEAARFSPILGRQLADPDFASVAYDDVKPLSGVEYVLTKGRDYAGSLLKGGVQTVGGGLSGFGELYGVATRQLEGALDQVLPNSAMSFLRAPVVPWYLAPDQVLKRPGQELKDFSKVLGAPQSRQGFDTDVVEAIGQLGTQIVLALTTGGATSTSLMFGQGADVMAEKTREDDATQAQKDSAIVLGAGITALTERYGLDKILNRVPPQIRNRTLRFIADKAAAGGIEAAQEITEGLLHDLTRRVFTNESAPILEGALQEASAAGVAAAIVRSALGLRGYRQASDQEAFFRALGDDAKASKLRERLPEKFQQLVERVSEAGPVQNVYIPADQFRTYYQSIGVDPSTKAAELNVRNYDEALASGTDIVVPISDFTTKLAPTDDLQGLIDDLRLTQGDMTSREFREYKAEEEARMEEIRQRAAEIVGETQVPAFSTIKQSMLENLVATGYEQSTADAYATVYAKTITNLAERAGIDPIAMHQRYDLSVTRPLPEVLSRDTRSDINIDPLLDRLRARDMPTSQQMYGRSLTDFLIDKGGLQPVAELTDIDKGRGPFQRNLLQPTGMSADLAAQAAVEAGYLQGRTMEDVTESDLFDAIMSEAGGGVEFSIEQMDTGMIDLDAQLVQLDQYLKDIGIDLDQITDNAEVRRLMEQASQDPEIRDAFDRLFQPAQTAQGAEIDLIGENEGRVLRREIDNLNEVEQAAFDDFMAGRPDAERIINNLTVHKGTPFAAQAMEGIFVRQAMLMYMRGETPQFESSLASNQVRKVRETLQAKGQEGMWQLLEVSGGMMGAAAKPVNNVNSSFINCDPSADCAKFCYATKGNYRYANVIVKSELVTLAVELDPVRAAKRVAAEYRATAEFANNKALRLFDKGDGDDKWLPFITELNKQGVRVQIFSKVPEFLRKVPDMNLRLLSIDNSNMEMADANLDLPVAFVYTGKDQVDALAKMAARNQIQVVLPVKLGSKLLDGTEISDLKKSVPAIKPYLCPIDAGVKKLGKTSQPGTWNCTSCDRNGGVGCFHGNVTKQVMQSLEVKPATSQERAQRILELRRQINELTTGTAEDLASAGRLPQERVTGLLDEVDALLGQLLADYDGGATQGTDLTIGSGTVEPGNGPAGSVQSGAGRRVIPITRLNQSAVGAAGADARLFQSVSQTVPQFFSSLQRGFQNAKQESMSGTQWAAWLKSNSGQLGIKKDEIEWTGINDFLELRGNEKLSKADIDSYLQANGVQIDETTLGDADKWVVRVAGDSQTYKFDSEVEAENFKQAEIDYRLDGQVFDDDGDYDMAFEEASDSVIVYEPGEWLSVAKYQQWTLPGGENYREILLTLPTQEQKRNERFRQIASEMLTATPERYAELSAERSRLYDESKTADFTSAHWDQKNVVAHIRVNDRVDADGNKVLFVEEIQSDWGQEGKRIGFRSGAPKLTEQEDQRLVFLVATKEDPRVPDDPRRRPLTEQEQAELDDLQSRALAGSALFVPPAPFVTKTEGWLNLSLKRVMQIAVEGGYDKVAFVNGQQSADRYDLSKQVDRVEYFPDSKTLVAMRGGSAVLTETGVEADKLQDMIGKEAAQRILQQPTQKSQRVGETTVQVLEGESLQVGGQGMVKFYDQIVPQAVNSVLKKIGGDKLGQVNIGSMETAQGAEADALLADLGVEVEGTRPPTQPGFDVTDKMRETVMAGLPLFQGEGMADKRGFIQFGPERKFKIALLEKADLSTFLHESGHFYLEVMGDLAQMPEASDQIKADYQTILKFVGLENRDQLSLDGKSPDSAEYRRAVEAHEKFARANEAYLMEGKSPSVELRSIFQRFRNWLKFIYKEFARLNVELNDQVRGVFDRIYATDQEIDAAKAEMSFDPLFLDATAAGMTEAEFEAYKQSVTQATESGKEALQQKLMREMMRERETWWKEELGRVRQEVTEEVDQMPVYVAFKTLTDGDIKLNKDELIERYGAEYVKRLPRGFQRVYTTGEGMPLDAAARLLNYATSDALVEALIGMKPRNEYIKAEADRVMRERHGDMMTDGTIADMAKVALHNTQREKVLAAELRALRRKQREVAPFLAVERERRAGERRAARAALDVPPAQAFREAAKGMIGQTAIRDLEPQRFLNAQRREGKKAFKAMADGDFATAAEAKQKEILNHFLYLEAIKARDRSDKIAEYMRKFEKKETRQRIGKAGATYLEQIDAILDGYEFRRVPNKRIDRRALLNSFVQKQEEAGEPVNIPVSVLDDARQINYRRLSVDELDAINEAVRNIANLASLKNKLTLIAEKRTLDEVAGDAIAHVLANAKGGKAQKLETALPGEQIGRWAKGFMLIHKKFATYFRQMDGWQDNGMMWELFVRPLNNRADYEAVQRADATKRLREIFKAYSDTNMFAKTYVPQLGQGMTLQGRLMVALNWGRAENRQRLMDGNGFTQSQIDGIFETLTERDWKFVKDVWEFLDSYWPQISEQYERLYGVPPEKSDALPFETKFGTMPGGYFPIKYDPVKSTQAQAQTVDDVSMMMKSGAYVRSQTKNGFTKEVMENVNRAVRLDFGPIYEHVNEVVHDLALREYLLDTNKLLNHRVDGTTLKDTINEVYGDQAFREITNTIRDVAIGDVGAINAFDAALGHLRAGTSIAGMGWNLMTGLMQPMGITQSFVRVGPKWIAKGLFKWGMDAVNLQNSGKMIYEKSAFMRTRNLTQNREINEIRNQIKRQGKFPVARQAYGVVEDSFFFLITQLQKTVDFPTWLGAYEKALDNGATDARAIELADQAVLDSQGGGQIKDLASIQRGSQLMKIWTNFYSYFNTTFNLTVEAFGKTNFRDPVSIGRLAVDVLMLYTVPAVLTVALREAVNLAIGGDEPDEEELIDKLIQEQLTYAMGTMVGLREFATIFDPRFSYSGPAGARFIAEVERLGNQISQGELDEGLRKAVVNTAGILLHFPSGQVNRIIDGINALEEGKSESPAALIFGPPKD